MILLGIIGWILLIASWLSNGSVATVLAATAFGFFVSQLLTISCYKKG